MRNVTCMLSLHDAFQSLQCFRKHVAVSMSGSEHRTLLVTQCCHPAVSRDSVFDALVIDITAAEAAAGGSAADSESDSDDSSEQYTYCQQLAVGVLATRLFERGAAEGVKSRNRQVLYSISKDLEKAARKQRKRAAADPEAADEQQQPKQKKQKKQQQAQLPQHAEPQAVQEVEAKQQLVAVKEKKKKKQQGEQAGTHQDKAEQQLGQQSANGATPSRQEQVVQQNLLVEGAQQTPVAAAAVPQGAVTPQGASGKKSGKKKRQRSEADAQPIASPVAVTPAAQDSSNAGKRGVVINLKKNVYFAHGAPVPPEEIRTPPTAKPKGSALKTSSKLAPATAPVQRHASRVRDADRVGAKAKPVTPSSVPRVRAAAFF